MAGSSRLTTPRMAGLAGVLFAILFTLVLVLLHGSLVDITADGITGSRRARLMAATTLMPFAGIAFLWFIAVVRAGVGQREDKFYATVFLGSGLLFLAMMFAATATTAGLLAAAPEVEAGAGNDVTGFGAGLAAVAIKTYALRMAAVFMMSLATIWLKTEVMPRWLVVATYIGAVALLVVTDISVWITLAFPCWVLIVSMVVLLRPAQSDTAAAA